MSLKFVNNSLSKLLPYIQVCSGLAFQLLTYMVEGVDPLNTLVQPFPTLSQ